MVSFSASKAGFPAIGVAHVRCGEFSRTTWFRDSGWTFRETGASLSSNAIVFDSQRPPPVAASNALCGPARRHVRDLLGGAAIVAPNGYDSLLDAVTAFVFRDHRVTLKFGFGDSLPVEFSHYEWHGLLERRRMAGLILADSLLDAMQLWELVHADD